MVAKGTAAQNDEIWCLSDVVDPQWPTISLLAHIIERGRQLGDFRTSIASFRQDIKVLWQVGVGWLAMGTVVPYGGIRHLSGVVDPQRPVGVHKRYTRS